MWKEIKSKFKEWFIKDEVFYRPSNYVGLHLIERCTRHTFKPIPSISWDTYESPCVSVSGYLMYGRTYKDALAICQQLQKGNLVIHSDLVFRTHMRTWINREWYDFM